MLKSLDIVNELMEEKENECYKAYGIFLEKQIKELRQIKQDLEKYSKVMKLLEELFDEIEFYEGDELLINGITEEPIEEYFIDFDYQAHGISFELYSILDKLKELVGDNHD